MKILVVAPTPFFSDRGTHIRILEESLALEKLGHQVTIATYHVGKDISDKIDTTKIDVRRIRRLLFWYHKLEAGPDWQKVLLDIMLIRKVFNLARTQKPDVIHGHLHEGVLIGWIVQKALFWRKIKLVADFHGSLTKEMVSHGYLHGELKRIFSWIEKIIDQMGDFAITSSWEGTEAVKKIRTDGKVETVLDGVNLDSFDNQKTKEEIKKELELPANKFIIGYTGGLVANKGIGYLFEAILLILEKRRDVYFLFGGFPPEEVEKFVAKNNLQDFVRLVSPLDYFKLPEFLTACDLAVDPKDGGVAQASGKMLNYIAAGLPVVCFEKYNNHLYLDGDGYYAQEISSKGLARSIEGALNDPELKERGRTNKEQAKEFSWEKSGRQIDRIYKDLLMFNESQLVEESD